MDHRIALEPGIVLDFPGMSCKIKREIGRGSNTIVYEGSYADAVSALSHRVLIKELFPFDPNGGIRREGCGIVIGEQAAALWQLHRNSFLRGNDLHLQLLSRSPGLPVTGGSWLAPESARPRAESRRRRFFQVTP